MKNSNNYKDSDTCDTSKQTLLRPPPLSGIILWLLRG